MFSYVLPRVRCVCVRLYVETTCWCMELAFAQNAHAHVRVDANVFDSLARPNKAFERREPTCGGLLCQWLTHPRWFLRVSVSVCLCFRDRIRLCTAYDIRAVLLTECLEMTVTYVGIIDNNA